MTTLTLDGVTKRYGRFEAVRDVSLTVASGETVGLFGPNGAGKSTLLRVLVGLQAPSEGAVRVGDEAVAVDRPAARRYFGVVTHDTMLYDGLTARENLALHARLHGVSDPPDRVAATLDRVGLAARGGDRPSAFSHGMRRRLSLARALLHDPPVVVLDEPYAGLDQRAAAVLDDVLDDFADRTVVLTTHDLGRAFERCSRAVLLDRGELVDDVDVDGLAAAADLRARYEAAVEGHATTDAPGGSRQ
jgi:heme exporter protein A